LNEYSAKLRELAKAICRDINLTEDIRIILVFRHFYEHEAKEYIPKPTEKVIKTNVDEHIEGDSIESLYDPKKKAIVLPIRSPRRYLHHMCLSISMVGVVFLVLFLVGFKV